MEEKEQIYNLLKEVFILLDSGDRRLFSRYGLTVPRYYALYHVSNTPGISLSKLSNRMFCDKSNITRIIQGLEADGYISRRLHETDKRTLRVYLTEKGTAVFQQVTSAHKKLNQMRLNNFDKETQRQLQQNLSYLKQNLNSNGKTSKTT